MSSFEIADAKIGSQRTFIIAEIGQNHQGDITIAKKMIAIAKSIGADCVKFQKSCLKEKFTSAALERPYNSINSWGKTYGEHKQNLEFSIDQYKDLHNFASELDIIFTASAMDIQSFEDLLNLDIPAIKIGSGDANNIPLLTKAAKCPIPLIISTGMLDEQMVERIVEIMKSNGKTNYCLLHCVSAYPTEPEFVKLRMLDRYRHKFPGICLGYSGHEQGIGISVAAVLLGAKVIERHFTLDKHQKGTDHQLSLEPNEFKELISYIREVEHISLKTIDSNEILSFLSNIIPNGTELNNVQLALKPVQQKEVLDCEMPCRMKLGKSLVYSTFLKPGSIIAPDMISVKVSEPFGISAERFDEFIGRKLQTEVQFDENVKEKHFIGFFE